MKVYKFIVSLARCNNPFPIMPLEEKIITSLKEHQVKFNQQKKKAILTVYYSRINPYNSQYLESFDGKDKQLNNYKDELEEQIRYIIRAFNISDNIYDVNAEPHPNSYC